jgi:hypothetical protein
VEYETDVPGLNNGQVTTDSDGECTIKIPDNTPPGDYTLIATAKKEGYKDGSAEINLPIRSTSESEEQVEDTGDVGIPGFPLISILLGFILGSIILITKRRHVFI